MGKRGATPKECKTKESRCGYHSKVCTQMVSTMYLFEILVRHYFYTVLLEKGVSNKGNLKATAVISQEATAVATNPIKIRGQIFLKREGMIWFSLLIRPK
jgi:hypothetical protein